MDIMVLRGNRVVLRGWEPRDAEPFAAMNSDPVVMEHFTSPLTRGDSNAMMERLQQGLESRGWGAWCLDIGGTCAGFVGLTPVSFEAHFTPCVEIGWRVAAALLGQGLRHRGRPPGARGRLQHGRSGGNRFVHGGGEPAFSPRDGTSGHATQCN